MKFNKWQVFASLLILLAVILAAIFLQSDWPTNFLTDQFLKKSTAQVFIDQGKLYLQFTITPSDQAAVAQFTNNVGWSDHWLQGISLTVDQATLDRLATSLPAELRLQFTDRSLSFRSSNLSLVRPLIGQQSLRIASGSSELEFTARSDSDYYLRVVDPQPLLAQATSSGVVSLSQKVEPLFLSLKKIAEVIVRVDGKYIEGEVILK